MSRWLSMLKEAPPRYETYETPGTGGDHPRYDATKPTKPGGAGGFVGFVATPGHVSERSEGSPPKSEPPPTSTEDRLRRIAAEHGLDWCEIQRWLRPEDVEASRAYLDSENERDRLGVVFWLKILSDKSIPKMPVEWLPGTSRKPS
jgi:hypothetical protein